MMKKTIAEDLAKRNYKKTNRFFWWCLANIGVPLVKGIYGKQKLTTIDNINECKGGKFILYNHQSRFDYINIAGFCKHTPVNFVIGYNEFFRSKFHTIFKMINAIPKKNFTTDLVSIKAMTSVIKSGGTVCFAPEGMSSICGHNQPIVPGTGKFLKHFNVPVYLMKSKGAYLVSHKVCNDNRKGNIEAEMKCLFTSKQLKLLSAEEIDQIINKELWQDDYEWNKEKKNHYAKMENATSHFEDLIYYCPKCGKEFGIKTQGNKIECSYCGNGAVLDDTYEFHPFKDSLIPESLSKWFDEERKYEFNKIRQDPNYSFSVEDCILGELPKSKFIKKDKTSIPCGKGKVICNHQGFSFIGDKNGKPFSFTLTYDKFWTLVIVTDCSFTGLYINGEYFDIIPPRPVIGKLLLMVEEFSRYHFNVWPNFPWMDNIYKL